MSEEPLGQANVDRAFETAREWLETYGIGGANFYGYLSITDLDTALRCLTRAEEKFVKAQQDMDGAEKLVVMCKEKVVEMAKLDAKCPS